MTKHFLFRHVTCEKVMCNVSEEKEQQLFENILGFIFYFFYIVYFICYD